MSIPVLVFALFAASEPPHLTSPEASARTEGEIGPGSGYETQKCVPGLRYQPDPLIVSTTVSGLRRTRRLRAFEEFMSESKPPKPKFFADLLCSDAAFTPMLEFGSVPSGFGETRAVLGAWSQDACGNTTAVFVVARNQEHVVAASFELRHVFGGKFSCDDRVLETDKDCAAREECVKGFFADDAKAKELRQDLGRALDALVFAP